MPENLVSEIGFGTNGTSCHLQGWVVNVESVNKFRENFYHYLRDNRGFK